MSASPAHPDHPHHPAPAAARENPWLNLIFNIFLPTLILMKLSPESRLGPQWALVAGCSLPLGYGIYDYIKRREINFFSILGLVAVLVKGTFGLLETDAIWIACSEAALPLIFGAAILWSTRWEPPLVQRFILSPQVFDVDRIHKKLALQGTVDALRPLMVMTSVAYAGTMLISAILNFGLAKALLKAEPGTEEFIAQLGKFTGLQYPVIALPLMVLTLVLLIWMMKKLGHLTGVPAHELLVGDHQKPEKSSELETEK